MTRLPAPLLALALSLPLAAGAARAAAADAPAPPPTAPPPARPPEPLARWTMGFAAELGGSPAVFGAKLGAGVLRRADEGAPARRWMLWLEADGTDWFRPDRPAAPGRVDRILWISPQLELARQLVRRPGLSGFVRAGPTLGRYTVNDGAGTLWFPGGAAGAGLLLDPLRVEVMVYAQWKTSTVAVPAPPDPRSGASPDVRTYPMVLFTVGLEYLQPFQGRSGG